MIRTPLQALERLAQDALMGRALAEAMGDPSGRTIEQCMADHVTLIRALGDRCPTCGEPQPSHGACQCLDPTRWEVQS